MKKNGQLLAHFYKMVINSYVTKMFVDGVDITIQLKLSFFQFIESEYC